MLCISSLPQARPEAAQVFLKAYPLFSLQIFKQQKFRGRTKVNTIHTFCRILLIAAIATILSIAASAATIGPKLQVQLDTLADNASVGMVIVSFNTNNGLQESHLNVLRSVGVTGGQTFPVLGMVAQPMTAGQVQVTWRQTPPSDQFGQTIR